MQSLTEPSDASYWHWSLAGFRDGVMRSLPILPGTIVFGAAFSALAAQRGITLVDTVLINIFVFSGMAQMLALEAWSDPVTLGSVVALTVITLIANLRYVLVGASLYPLFCREPAWRVYPILGITCDSSWLITLRAHGEGVRSFGLCLGATLTIWLSWVAAAWPGYFLGALITDPHRIGLDFVMPAFFVSLLVPLWRGPMAAIPWLVAGAVSVAVYVVFPGWWFLIVGAIAGSAAGAFVPDDA